MRVQNEQVVTIERDDYSTTSSGIGGSGMRSFILKATQSGSALFRLKLWREWEGDASIRERFEVAFHIK